MNRRISLSEMSKLLNISKHTLRYYDKIGLITPSYDSNGYRYYSIDHYYVLSTIKLLREMDVSIKDIKKSLNDDNLEDFVQLLVDSKEHIDI
ncbi:MerR family transcriptional regulator [Vallitalea guaymasensis]|uniref:MerR family transcriptional regulator n=1 Tax=Vallitalea guaymasensis TaxID=1185412 RepID=UPI000DE3D090|nr:MerR family transcriptional regulator [Vallitalea guaymasensis]